YLGVDDKMNDLLNTSNHEFIHASNSGINDYSFKGIDFPTLVSDSKSPGVQSTISYLNKNPEKQVRGVRALQFLKESGKWSSGEVTDDMIDHLRKSSYYGKGLPNDVGNLVTNLDDQNLKKFLNTVYSTVPAYGVAKILSQETNDNMKYKKGNSSKKRYANGGVKDGPTNGFATPYHIPGSYMKEGLIYNADNELMIRDSSNKKYYPLGSDISALRRPDKIKSTERAKNKEFTLGMLQKDYDENVKNLSYPPEKYNIPEYNLGGWIKDNKQGVMGGLTAAAGIGAMFIPGAQGVGASLIGSGINGIAGEVKQDQIAEQQAQANIEAQGSLASPAATNTFKCGGRYKKMANGGLVEWQGGEPLMTPGGKIVRTPKSMPSHANGGVKGFVPDGTAFLGKKRNPETGNTYMQDGDKLGKIQQKADNILKASGNKLSRNSAILNKKNSIDKFNLLMSKQEAGKSKKMKNGGYKKMANGGDVPPTASTPTTAGAFVGPEAAPAMAPWNQYKDFTAGVTGGMVDSIDPVNDPNQNVGPINVPRVKNTFGTNFGNFMENNGSTLASLAPVAFNAVNAMMPRERERLPYQYNKANAMLADRRFDIRPILRQNRIAQRIGDQNAKILGGGATASNRAVNTASRMGADMNAYSTKNNMENQYRAQQAQGMFQTGAAQRGVDVANLQNEAARRNMLGSSLSQFSNFAQNRELMNNMGDRDLQRLQILSRAYPFYNKQFGDINYG
ncbi:MAG TPA: hypothetical protein VJ907_06750, partial [Halanaerobiales bacterium]|nr:hypothetical protein [Halanaerobiales bacterium]